MENKQSLYEKLNAKLPPELIKTRKVGGYDVSYIDAWAVIENANRIYGYDGWEFQLQDLTPCEHGEITTKDRDGKDRNGWRVAYIAVGIVKIGGQTFREVGFGNGVSYNSVGDATESAVKEAATDCMKRCLRFQGNQFGLALYDKSQRNVDEPINKKIRSLHSSIKDAQHDEARQEITAFLAENKAAKLDDLSTELSNKLYCQLRAKYGTV